MADACWLRVRSVVEDSMANDAWSVTANGFVPLSKTVNVHNNSPLHWVFGQALPQDQSVEERLSEPMACSGDAVLRFQAILMLIGMTAKLPNSRARRLELILGVDMHIVIVRRTPTYRSHAYSLAG